MLVVHDEMSVSWVQNLIYIFFVVMWRAFFLNVTIAIRALSFLLVYFCWLRYLFIFCTVSGCRQGGAFQFPVLVFWDSQAELSTAW